MSKTLSVNAIVQIADELKVHPAALLAVKEVESGNKSGFLDESGRPQILFEGHIFYKHLKQYRPDIDLAKVMTEHHEIVYSIWTKRYYKGGEGEWERLHEARLIDEDLANMSASWGMFQIMGFNYKACKCQNIQEFVSLMNKDAESQFRLSMNYLRSKNLIPILQKMNWEAFAREYNGPGYVMNAYDQKLKLAYNKWFNKLHDEKA